MTIIYTKPLIMRQANLIEKKKNVPKKGGSCPWKPVGAIRDINSIIHYTNGRAGLWPFGVPKLILENDDRGCYGEKVTFHGEIYYWTEVGEISWCTIRKKNGGALVALLIL